MAEAGARFSYLRNASALTAQEPAGSVLGREKACARFRQMQHYNTKHNTEHEGNFVPIFRHELLSPTAQQFDDETGVRLCTNLYYFHVRAL